MNEQQKTALKKIIDRRGVQLPFHSKSVYVYNSLVKLGLVSRISNNCGYEYYPKDDVPESTEFLERQEFYSNMAKHQ